MTHPTSLPTVSPTLDQTASCGPSIEDIPLDFTGVRHWPKSGPSAAPSTIPQLIPPDDVSPVLESPLPPSTPLHQLSPEDLAKHIHSPSAPDSKVNLLSTMTQAEVLKHLHTPGFSPPPIRPCDTPNPSDTKTHWTAEELHHVTGCRRFKNYKHLIQTSKDGVWVDGGEFPLALGTYTTIPKAKRGGPIDRTKYKYLDIVHCDIAFGDGVAVGGIRYALVFADRATRYTWVFSLKSLHHSEILSAFKHFRAEAGRLAVCFRCDCDEKLFGSFIKDYLLSNDSNIKAAPAGRQSANGLVESHWKTMVHMSRAYLTEKQMPKNFWFYSIKHAARMMNMIPGKYKGKLCSPFMLAHGAKPDQRTWFPIFSMCYFHHEKDGDVIRSNNQAHTMDGIAIGRCTDSNALLVYNPRNKQFYQPDSYRLDPYRLPGSVYPSMVYDGGLFCSLYRDKNHSFQEPYPPGTRVEDLCPDTKRTIAGTVMDIPLQSSNDAPPRYLIQFDNNSTKSVPPHDMPNLIPKAPVPLELEASPLLPPFLQIKSKITYEHEGQYFKGYLAKRDNIYRFVFKRHPNSKKEEWGVDLPDLPTTWNDLCVQGILLPGHTASSFLRSSVSPSPSPTSSPTFDPVASFVSAINLHRDCPASLLRALADNHPDKEIWLQSYYEEKQGIEDLGTFERLTLSQYRALRENGAPRAIPSMCVLTVKKDEQLMPLRAKSRIVVLGNHEDRDWTKSQRFAPVLKSESLRLLTSLAVERRRVLKQGDCNNAFCQSHLPPDETTIIRPPSGDPDVKPNEYWLLKKTLYGLRRSPRHWFNKINAVLLSMGLKQNKYDPCLYTGFIVDPDDPSDTPSVVPLTLGLYVDDFVFFSTSDSVEAKFQRILAKLIKVEFMGTVEWFLGIHFNWRITPSEVSVHLNQAAFAANLVERFNLHTTAPSPMATPYRSGLPIDAIPDSTVDDTAPSQVRRREAYQSLVGSLGWLSNNTRPDVAPVHSFLSSYNSKPTPGHMKAALYALHYVHSTHDYGISFTSKDTKPMHTYLHFPDKSDAEAYTDAVPPTSESSHKITTYSDACWGSQIGSAVREGTLLPLFKFRSMSGAIIFRSGGPIIWKSVRQDRTSLSSCEAEIRATNEGSKLTMALRNVITSLAANGYPIYDAEDTTIVYNDNESCVNWSRNMTSKNTRHMEMRDNSIREWVEDKSLSVQHVKGTCNPSDIFTKEMKDGTHFRRLRDSFMCRYSDFLRDSLSSIYQRSQHSVPTRHFSSPDEFLPVAQHCSHYFCTKPTVSARAAKTASSYFDVLASNSVFQTPFNLSHLSSAGRHLLSKLSSATMGGVCPS